MMTMDNKKDQFDSFNTIKEALDGISSLSKDLLVEVNILKKRIFDLESRYDHINRKSDLITSSPMSKDLENSLINRMLSE